MDKLIVNVGYKRKINCKLLVKVNCLVPYNAHNKLIVEMYAANQRVVIVVKKYFVNKVDIVHVKKEIIVLVVNREKVIPMLKKGVIVGVKGENWYKKLI